MALTGTHRDPLADRLPVGSAQVEHCRLDIAASLQVFSMFSLLGCFAGVILFWGWLINSLSARPQVEVAFVDLLGHFFDFGGS